MSGAACRDAVRELLPFYLNGSLQSDEAAVVRSHLESCATCSAELDELSQLATAIERHGAVDLAPARRGPLLLAVAVAIPVLALIVWAYLTLGTAARVVVMDLGSGPARDASALPLLEVSGERELVRFVFFVPASPGARYSAEIRDANGSILLPEQGLGQLDSMGRAHLEVPASRLGAGGERELLAYRENDGSDREIFRFPFTLRLARERGHEPPAGAEGPEGLDELNRLFNAGAYAEAEAFGRSLLKRLDAEGRGLDAARVIDRLAFVFLRGGKGTEPGTLELARRGLATRESVLGSEHPHLSHSLNALAYVHYRRAEYAQARAMFERGLAVLQNADPPKTITVIAMRHNLANLLADTGDYLGARDLYEQSLADQERLWGSDDPRLGQSLDTLALVLFDLGDFEAAREIYERALPLVKQARGADHPDISVMLENYAKVLGAMGHAKRARQLVEQALQIREAKLGPHHPLVATGLTSLAGFLAHDGKYESAQPMLERALSVREEAFGLDHPAVAASSVALADLLDQRGDIDAARAGYLRAIRIREEKLGPDHPLTAESLVSLARFQARTGSDADALEASLRAESIIRRQVQRMSRRMAEQRILKYAAVQTSGLDVAQGILAAGTDSNGHAARTAAIWDAIIRSRGQVLDEMVARHRTLFEARTPVLDSLFEALDVARTNYSAMIVAGPGVDGAGEFLGRLEAAREEIDGAERALAAESATFRQDRNRGQGGFDEAARALPKGSALLAFSLFNLAVKSESEPAYMAYVLAPGRAQPKAILLGPASKIDALIDGWREQAGTIPADEQALEAYRDAARALRRVLWDPLAPLLGRAGRVLIVPDGKIHLVNFATLPDDEKGYLLESGPTLHYLSAERDLLKTRPPAAPTGGLLAVGGVDFDESPLPVVEQLARLDHGSEVGASGPAGSPPVLFRGPLPECFDLRRVPFPSLPSSGSEVRAVARLWRSRADADPVLLLTGKQAGEGIVKRLSPRHRVLQLATHAVSISDSCEDSGATRHGGLHLAGLVLSGANLKDTETPDGEDGILTSEEIASLDLRGVEWVVLSGCQTGVGPILKSEGIFGLRRTFTIAGARTLILSLWPVTDHDAREWILGLYRKRLEGLSTSEAVRQAGLAVVDARRRAGVTTHPFFWGAFVAAGDWR